MSTDLHIGRIRNAVELLELVQHSGRLSALKNLALNNGGTWDLPSDKPGVYDPLIKTVQVFGVFAMSEDIAELPKNWLSAATNILGGLDDATGEAANPLRLDPSQCGVVAQ